jgi:hypothetical protein
MTPKWLAWSMFIFLSCLLLKNIPNVIVLAHSKDWVLTLHSDPYWKRQLYENNVPYLGHINWGEIKTSSGPCVVHGFYLYPFIFRLIKDDTCRPMKRGRQV